MRRPIRNINVCYIAGWDVAAPEGRLGDSPAGDEGIFYAKLRNRTSFPTCDDSVRSLTVLETSSNPTKQQRLFRKLSGATARKFILVLRHWAVPPRRFRHGDNRSHWRNECFRT